MSQQAISARLSYWTEVLAAGQRAGDQNLVREAKRFVDEFTTLLAEMKEDTKVE